MASASATAAADDDRSTVPEALEDAAPPAAPQRTSSRQQWSAAEDAALAAAVREWHADGEAVQRYRASWRRGAARLCCWESVAALAAQRCGLLRSASSASSRFNSLLAQGLATQQPGQVTPAQAWAMRGDPAAAAARL